MCYYEHPTSYAFACVSAVVAHYIIVCNLEKLQVAFTQMGFREYTHPHSESVEEVR